MKAGKVVKSAFVAYFLNMQFILNKQLARMAYPYFVDEAGVRFTAP